MGHDIYGFRKQNELDEIAYLRRGAFDAMNSELYKALDCPDAYGAWSGLGVTKEFNKEHLIKALDYLKKHEYNKHLWMEIDFIEKCIENIEEEKTILINFA